MKTKRETNDSQKDSFNVKKPLWLFKNLFRPYNLLSAYAPSLNPVKKWLLIAFLFIFIEITNGVKTRCNGRQTMEISIVAFCNVVKNVTKLMRLLLNQNKQINFVTSKSTMKTLITPYPQEILKQHKFSI